MRAVAHVPGHRPGIAQWPAPTTTALLLCCQLQLLRHGRDGVDGPVVVGRHAEAPVDDGLPLLPAELSLGQPEVGARRPDHVFAAQDLEEAAPVAVLAPQAVQGLRHGDHG